jgi:hypothetical protein
MVVGTPQVWSFIVAIRQDKSMRLLVFDEYFWGWGSLQTFCLNLLPAL